MGIHSWGREAYFRETEDCLPNTEAHLRPAEARLRATEAHLRSTEDRLRVSNCLPGRIFGLLTRIIAFPLAAL